MGKRKVKVEAKPMLQFSEADQAEMEANPLGMRVAMGLTKPQPMSDARLKHVREIMERGARVGIELSHSLTQEVLNEIDRLRAEVAAKDAEIARLRREIEPTDEEEERAARMQPHYFDEPYKPKRKKRTGKAKP